MKVVELDAVGSEQRLGELAQLLLEAHGSNVALGLAAPPTRAGAEAAWCRTSSLLEQRATVLGLRLLWLTTHAGTDADRM